MELREGMAVVTADGQEVGTLDRVVMDPRTKEVTDLVVRQGLLFTEDKVVPAEWVLEQRGDQIVLGEDIAAPQDLPAFEESEFVPAGHYGRDASPQAARPYYWYPPIGAWAGNAYLGYPTEPYYLRDVERNVPEGTVVLKEGIAVVTDDGQHVGDVERLFIDPDSKQATHLLVSHTQGLLRKRMKLVPTSWVAQAREEQVSLTVGSDELEELPDYRPGAEEGS
ncbi:MAG: PRC-barrel domain-containing protein [Actinomycetota bacterium]|nr:PRC-barrel domain-containing protein [Actinomycetota bacterium]